MAELRSREDFVFNIPDNLTLVQFILDSHHPSRPTRPPGKPWLIDDDTGRGIELEEVRVILSGYFSAHNQNKIRERVFGLANGMNINLNIGTFSFFLRINGVVSYMILGEADVGKAVMVTYICVL